MLNRESQKSLNHRHPDTANRRFNQLWSRYKILLWRNKCLTVAAFAANGGVLRFLAEEDCPLIAHVNNRRKQQTATDPHSVAIADRQRHHICARQFRSRLAPDYGRL